MATLPKRGVDRVYCTIQFYLQVPYVARRSSSTRHLIGSPSIWEVNHPKDFYALHPTTIRDETTHSEQDPSSTVKDLPNILHHLYSHPRKPKERPARGVLASLSLCHEDIVSQILHICLPICPTAHRASGHNKFQISSKSVQIRQNLLSSFFELPCPGPGLQ